jgi:hypothetical protein
MQGAKLLGSPEPKEIRSMHRTTFLGCEAGVFCVLDEDNICTGYQLVILDHKENHRYDFPFDTTLKNQWLQEIAEMPDQGQKPEEQKQQ